MKFFVLAAGILLTVAACGGSGGTSDNTGGISDLDGDTIADAVDNCPGDSNFSQLDSDSDGIGDLCDATPDPVETDPLNLDSDRDGIADSLDNCPADANSSQMDSDGDSIGDVCDTSTISDDDQDGLANSVDNCVLISNPRQEDSDGDGQGNACDNTPNGPDTDGDTIADSSDNCIVVANADQRDGDDNGVGDVCDNGLYGDLDSDGIINELDVDITGGFDSNQNGVDDNFELDVIDSDLDTVADAFDNCAFTVNPAQTDSNLDGVGDACRIAVFGACGNEGGLDPGLQASTTTSWSDNCHVQRGGEWADSGYALGIQTVLSCLNYSIQVDGIFGPETESVVVDFQVSRGLGGSGIVDEATWLALQNELFFAQDNGIYQTYAAGNCLVDTNDDTDIAFDWDIAEQEWEVETYDLFSFGSGTEWFQFSIEEVQYLR